ncbi:nicotinate-nucleotide pyrophosphorylase [Terriglobus saanensis SP1PR4]|uniref:Probable nicotinate-nucleotide pyrophosphorylase [carboxylating] n=2 Tax=Terriglobus saanensis TaxID=870903 RepID=E8V3U5_TERSS|nr:carboxylating nicotinate-nucleotide diphosphorylase [Terriglobus saanensis]ADV81359.1 nicotinate-nucleotide pyrophosphorylase [Terriglobus saanensis SP1PR4]
MEWKSKKVAAILEAALLEDKAMQDITTALTVGAEVRASATVITRQECVIAGLGAIIATFDVFNHMLTQSGRKSAGRFEVVSHAEIFDGVRVKSGKTIAVIRHNARAILSCERVILNLLQRMSGIATLTNDFVKETKGTKAKVLDTRKTIPGLRVLDKYAVCCGGGQNHRQDLQDGILIKSSHIALAGGITLAIELALKGKKAGQIVEIEVRSIAEVEEAMDAGAEALLLVEMTPSQVAKAVKTARAKSPKVKLEAADHLSLDTVRDYAATGVDFVSVGALTRSAMAADISMRITSEVY